MKTAKLINMDIAQTIYQLVINSGLGANAANLFVAWSKHETGNFTSNLFKKYNNLFGYSYYKGSAYQLPAGGSIADNGQPIAAYDNPANSVFENIAWIKRRQSEGRFPKDLNNVTPDQFAAALKSAGYYGDTLANYTAGLKRFFTNNAGSISIVGVVILGAIAYYAINGRFT